MAPNGNCTPSIRLRLAPALLAVAVVAAGHASAEPAAGACTSAGALPSALAGWGASSPLSSAAARSGVDTATLRLGQGADVALHPTDAVAYAAPPQKPPTPGTFGGLVALAAPEAGVYQIAASAPAWIDILDGAAPVASVAHTPGPACTTIRKVVDFPLHQGRYLVQVSGASAASVRLMAVRRP